MMRTPQYIGGHDSAKVALPESVHEDQRGWNSNVDGHESTKYLRNLLIDEPPLQVLPSLVMAVGLNKAIFLQQLHYWLRKPGAHVRDGKVWVYNTYEDWHDQFPWWKPESIRKMVKDLERDELIETTSKYNHLKVDRTKWYTIRYENLPE